MKKPAFKTGDVVEIRSGGPCMTVVRHAKNGFECCWFDREQKQHTFIFPAAALAYARSESLTTEQLERIAAGH